MLTDFRLKVFESVARRLNFTRAAEELFITQPAVTRHIRELEQQFECRLFKRCGRKVALTEDGEKLLVSARRILKEYVLLHESMAGDVARMQGELRMGASTTLTQYVLPPILALFNRMYPDIRVDLMDGNTEYIESSVAGEAVQLGMIEGNGEHADLHYQPFIQDEIVLVAAPGNALPSRREWTVEQLKELPLVMREAGSGTLDVVRKALAEKGLREDEWRVSMHLGSSESIKRYLLKSDSAAFLSLFAVREELERGTLVRIPVKNLVVKRTFRFVTPHGEQSRLSGLMIRFCLDYYNKM